MSQQQAGSSPAEVTTGLLLFPLTFEDDGLNQRARNAFRDELLRWCAAPLPPAEPWVFRGPL